MVNLSLSLSFSLCFSLSLLVSFSLLLSLSLPLTFCFTRCVARVQSAILAHGSDMSHLLRFAQRHPLRVALCTEHTPRENDAEIDALAEALLDPADRGGRS